MKLIFISENLDFESHTTEAVDVLSQHFEVVESINLTSTYRLVGIDGIVDKIGRSVVYWRPALIVVALGASCLLPIGSFSRWRLCSPGLKICTAFSDSEYLFDVNDFYYAQAADFSLVANPLMEWQFKLYNLEFVGGQLFDERVYSSSIGSVKNIPVSFVGGTYRAGRENYLRHLEEDGIDVRVAGYGSKAGIVTRQEKNNLIRSSWIHLSFSHVHSPDLRRFKRLSGFKGRVVECLKLGTFPLCEHTSMIGQLFGSACLTFSNNIELKEKILYCLDNKDTLSSRVESMLAYYERKYSNSIIIENIKRLVRGQHAVISEVSDSTFERNFNRHRYFYFGFFLSQRPHMALGEGRSIYFRSFNFILFLYWLSRGFIHSLRITYSKFRVQFARRIRRI